MERRDPYILLMGGVEILVIVSFQVVGKYKMALALGLDGYCYNLLPRSQAFLIVSIVKKISSEQSVFPHFLS